MSWTPQRNGSATQQGRPDALSRATGLSSLAELLAAGLTVVWKDELEALHRDREALAAQRKEALGLRLEVLFLQVDLDRCRYELEHARGW